MPRRILLLLGQLPFDPASGAARSMRGIAEVLATAHTGHAFEVRAIGTTATEQGIATGQDPAASAEHYARAAGAPLSVDPDSLPGHRVFRTSLRGISYALLHTAGERPHALSPGVDSALDSLLAHETSRWNPDIVLTFGGREQEVRRREHLRNRGAAIVFGLRNLSYKSRDAFHHVDAVLTPSTFLTTFYANLIGLRSTPIPSPIEVDDVRARTHDPKHLTIINPTPEKGLMVFARIAHDISTARPDIPIMVVESRGTAGLLVRAGLAGGFDLRAHRNILVSPGVSRPAIIFAATRVLLVPSVWEEPFGRVGAEALVNGVPAIVSDRGGLPEAVRDGGFTLPIPPDITPRSRHPASSDAVAAWTALAIRLMTEAAFYRDASDRARSAGEHFLPQALSPRYVDYFSSIVRVPGPTRGPGLDEPSRLLS